MIKKLSTKKAKAKAGAQTRSNTGLDAKNKPPTRAYQVAALPWRRGEDGIAQVLLVTSRETRRWVLPKGWPLKNRSPSKAAAREAWEEAGVRGPIASAPVGTYEYPKRLPASVRLLTVAVYPLQVTEEHDAWPEVGQRERRWVDRAAAAQLVDEPGLKALLGDWGPEEKTGDEVHEVEASYPIVERDRG